MADPLDDLYGAPLTDFTQLRNELVKSLKQAGNKTEATRVGKFKKPTVPAWAMNQLARREADAIENLIQIQKDLGEAGDARTLKKLGAERRRAVTSLTEKAKEILADSGSASGASTLEKVSSSLLAASGEEDLELLRAGRLEKEFTSSGFKGMLGGPGGFKEVEQPAEEPPKVDPQAARRARAHAESLAKEATDAEKKARSLAEKASAIETQLETAKDAAKTQEAAATALRRAADEALEELETESAS